MRLIVVGLEEGLLRLQGESPGTAVEVALRGPHVTSLAAHPSQPRRLYAGTFGEGLWQSEDEGKTWHRGGEGLESADVTALAAGHPEAGGTAVLWAGTEPSNVYRREDGGEAWQLQPGLAQLPSHATWSFPPRPYTHHVRWLMPDAARPGLLYASIEAGGIMRSWDGGRTWHDRVPGAPRDGHGLYSHRGAPGRVFVAAGEGYYESPDHGETWDAPQAGLRHHYLWSVAVDAGDPQTVLVSAAAGPGAAHSRSIAHSTVYRRDGADAWQEIEEGLPPVRGSLTAMLAADGSTPGVFYLASNRGLYRSGDGGRSWRAIIEEWPSPFAGQRATALLVM